MVSTIKVKIPGKCFVSPNPAGQYPFPFFFQVTFGQIAAEALLPNALTNNTEGAAKLTITISGFEKLLSPDKIKGFVENLSLTPEDDWNIKKSAKNNDIVMTYLGEELNPNFHFRAEAAKFVSDAKKNETVVLTVRVSQYNNMGPRSYTISTKVDYTPWAKSITFSKSPVRIGEAVDVNYTFDGDNVDKVLLQNGYTVNTNSSPYRAIIDRPSQFKLEVFNHSGIRHECDKQIDVEPPKIKFFRSDRSYFTQDESVTLTWDLCSISSFQIKNVADHIEDNHVTVRPKLKPGDKTVTYELTANGYINQAPGSVKDEVTLCYTDWKKSGSATGFFAGDVYDKMSYNGRIFTYHSNYYCYAHPKIYESADGINWKEYAVNNKADGTFICAAAGFYKNFLYAMGREGPDGQRLKLSTFNFETSAWEYLATYQSYCSEIGNFQFDEAQKCYLQIVPAGIFGIKCNPNNQWTLGTFTILAPSGKKAISGDYCFFKDRYYAVMLCEDHYFYVYDCSKPMRDVKFRMKAGTDCKFVFFVQTLNSLYILTDQKIVDAEKKKEADVFYPQLNKNGSRPWTGVNSDSQLFGIYPDKNMWVYHI